MTTLPRGIRNNNPGNIRWSNSNWNGLLPEGKTIDKSFCVFKEPEWGIRALVKLISNYYKLYKIDTIEGIINRYAPSNENNTKAYVDHVCKIVGCSATEKLKVTDREVMIKILKGIILHENGVQPYTDELLSTAMTLAGI